MSDNHTVGGFKNAILNTFQSGVDKVQVSLQKSGNSTFYPTTLSVQCSQKNGWLRKQGGVVKSWKKRWFTLKGDQLYYYLSDDESKPPQGVIPLAGNNVVELPLTPGKSDEFIFEIVPGGDKTKMTTTHDTYPICASSEDERKGWVLVIRRIMFSQIGGAIFGQNLEETLMIEHRHRRKRKACIQKKVPEIVESCVDFLMKYGLEVEGIFRLPGRTSLIRELKESFDTGKRPQLDIGCHDVQTVASLLKLYLRELPEPIIRCASYEPVMKIVNRDFHEDPDAAVERLSEEMTKLPKANYNLLQYLCNFLHEVAQHSDVNKMTEINLATVFVHAVIRPEDEDPALLMATANPRTQTVFLFINKHADILNTEYTARGDAIVTEDILDVGDLLQTESRPFHANDLATYTSSVLDSPCGKSMTEEILDLTNSVGNANNPLLPEPLSPITRADPNNRRGSRKGRFFKNYLDKESAISTSDTAGEEDEEGIFDDDYSVIEDITLPVTRNGSETSAEVAEQKTRPDSWNYARSRNGILSASYTSEDYSGQPTPEDDDGYSRLPAGENDSGRHVNLCESVSSIEEDYSTLTEYTSDYSALLRSKSSEMYSEAVEDEGRREVPQRPGVPAVNSRDTTQEGPSAPPPEGMKSLPTHQGRPSPPPPTKAKPSHPQENLDDLYRKVVKTNSGKKPPPRQENTDQDYGQVAPPIPAKRPVPIPRQKSVVLDSTEEITSAISHSVSLDSDLHKSMDSRLNSLSGSIKSNQSEYQALNDALRVDYSDGSREFLLAHIETLHDQLFTMREKHKKALQKFAQKLNNERTSTQEAVAKVMSLQADIQKYQLKYGPLQ